MQRKKIGHLQRFSIFLLDNYLKWTRPNPFARFCRARNFSSCVFSFARVEVTLMIKQALANPRVLQNYYATMNSTYCTTMNPTCHMALPWTLQEGIPWVATTSSRQRRSTGRDVPGFDRWRSVSCVDALLVSMYIRCRVARDRREEARNDAMISSLTRSFCSFVATQWWRKLYLARGGPATK